MEAYKTLYRFNPDDHFRHQLDSLHTSLQKLAAVVDANSRAQQVGRPPQYVVHQHHWRRTPKTQTPTLLFPLNVVALAIDALLTGCDQAVGRWVKEGIIARWMQRFFAWQRQRRRT